MRLKFADRGCKRNHRTVQLQVCGRIREIFEIGKLRGILLGGARVGPLLQVSVDNLICRVMIGQLTYDRRYFEVRRECIWSFQVRHSSLDETRNI